jgi:adenylate cyclase
MSAKMLGTLSVAARSMNLGASLLGHPGSTSLQETGNCPSNCLSNERASVTQFFHQRSPQHILRSLAFAPHLGERDVRVGGVDSRQRRSEGIAPRHRATVLAADVVGYSRLMEVDEEGTHARLMRLRFSLMEPMVALHHGRVIKNTGDGFMAMFNSAVAGLEAAHAMQRSVMVAEADVPADRRIAFRMGINVADVIVEDHDIYGDGVNVAARLQTLAEPGGIVISGIVAEQAGGTFGMQSVDLGQLQMRNRKHPVRVLSLRLPGAPANLVGEGEAGAEARPSIAVLPFRKLTAGGDDGYFVDGIVDNIIQSLAALRELFVISRGSTLGFGGGPIDARAIGRSLGVRYLLYGSVQRSGECLRIGTELSDAESGEVLRADHYDGNMRQLFLLQDRIAEETAKIVAPRVREHELGRVMRKHPQDMTAYDLVLQALDCLYRLDYASFSRARGLLQRAMIVDPKYAPAFALAARWHSIRVGQEWSPDYSLDREEAARLATAAIELDENDALAWALYGHTRSFLAKDFDSAIASFDRAIAVCPNLALAWTFKGATLSFLGEGPSALRCARKGLQLSPMDLHVFFAEHILSQSHYVNGDVAEAAYWARRSYRRNDRSTSNMRVLVASLVSVGDIEGARSIARHHAEIAPAFTLSAWSERTPFTGALLERLEEQLKAAGFPE